jgi:hypothetical protein
MQHFEKDHTDRPDVILYGVDVSFEGLRAHVQGRADVVLLLPGDTRVAFSKPEVSDFVDVVLYEDVGWFEVAVQEPAVGEVFEPFVDVAEHRDRLLLSELLPPF